MPLRVDDGVPVPVVPSSISELLGAMLDSVTVLPDENLMAFGPSGGQLEVPLFEQFKGKWCWAACAQMVLRFYGTFLKQCEIARRQLGKPCCAHFSLPSCNQDCSADEVDQAFTRAGLDSDRVDRSVSFDTIRQEINSGQNPRPLVAGVKWANGGGHLVVINGWRVVNNVRFVRVNDPIYGRGDIRYTDLRESYGPNDNGTWECTWLGLTPR